MGRIKDYVEEELEKLLRTTVLTCRFKKHGGWCGEGAARTFEDRIICPDHIGHIERRRIVLAAKRHYLHGAELPEDLREIPRH